MIYKSERQKQNIRAKRTLFRMRDFTEQVIAGKERYFLSMIMNHFFSLPTRFQKAFIEFFCSEIPHENWTRCLEDETLYPNAIRSIALYYTGLEDSSGAETTLEAFKNQLVGFLKSDFYKRARVVVKTKKSFADSLARL